MITAGVADALSQGIPSVLGTSGSGDTSVAYSTDAEAEAAAQSASRSGIRRQQNAAQRVLSGVAAALGAGGGRGPAHAGLPRIPGFPLLPGGIPRNEQGQIDVVQLIGPFFAPHNI